MRRDLTTRSIILEMRDLLSLRRREQAIRLRFSLILVRILK